MPIKLLSPIKKDFHLVKSDAELEVTDGATMVTICQATQGGHELRNDLNAELRREYDGHSVKVVQRISFDDIRRREVFLTLSACNILTEKGKPLFSFQNGRLVDESTFNKAWGELPPVIAQEIHTFVLEMNPLWNEGVAVPAQPATEETPEVPAKSGEAS